ncbi:RHS repeat-associated core domain-containing protein [Paenibacillus sp. 1011MAR3C5]|uniref:RHS repeat-associated core domain-containing protein n=1 Tax=Paenibacillus sp. 1011MAR3C5 TaxID=1675787 RepID=UPI0026C81246|nr:RHS repeat-associated core domain-containing protein [Paenibacillus sp. 1011MAR3C5]
MWERGEGGKTTRYYWDGDPVIAEAIVTNGTAKFHARYIRGNGLEAREDGQGKAYYLKNGHGDVIELRDSSGTLRLNQYDYDIFGNMTVQNELIPQPFKYSGEMTDSTTELQYLRARWYDPSIGRFVGEDTYDGQIDNPLTLNLYTYVGNNPLIYVDPSGHFWETIADVISIGWSAVEFWNKPSWSNAGFLAWDIAAAIVPFAPGSYVVKVGKLTFRSGEEATSYYNKLKKTQNLTWDAHGNKHTLNKKVKWDKKTIKATKSGNAKYKSGIDNEMLERIGWDQGTIVKNEEGQMWKIMKFDDVVGAHLGKETKYVVVKMSKNGNATPVIHGHPINESEALQYLKNA